MKYAIKGALFSGLLFPGVGQIVLKNARQGVILAVATLAAMVAFVVTATRIATSSIEYLTRQGQSVDMDTIVNAANAAVNASDNLILNVSLICMVLCWIAGVVDAYITGKKMDDALDGHASMIG
jgi:hypothetical protein